ncbi:hypothetical protein UAJ10_07880 [Nitrospirillum sp. BR 11164]|uniref:hypothetical protein n=1 Tax=Nitrospirillum sp. BR 11164 TaxID=3104324 RepID=UPI002AFFFC8B|nr:hypothetical protein [Nitrospirillum sp. BR 11164]MEA1648937.1 hypothetical protein [Nitrospirillum sp. BR 11164]
MADYYRNARAFLRADLHPKGYRDAQHGDGLHKTIAKGVRVTALLGGLWHRLSCTSGLRFDVLNKTLLRAASDAGWPDDHMSMFRLWLWGLFWEDERHFYLAAGDMDANSPRGVIATREEIRDHLLAEETRLSVLTDLEAALAYVCDGRLFRHLGTYMVPAAAKVTHNRELWDWSVSHFSAVVAAENEKKLPINRRDFDGLIRAIDALPL